MTPAPHHPDDDVASTSAEEARTRPDGVAGPGGPAPTRARSGVPGGPERSSLDGREHFPELHRSLCEIAGHLRGSLGHDRGALVVDGVGVTVEVGGALVFGSCNDFTQTIDDLQYGVHDGPCLQAQHSGELVRSGTIGAGETRWPDFTPRAARLDLRSVVSVPLAVSAHVRGSLNLYSATADAVARLEPDRVGALVDDTQTRLANPVLLAVAHANARWFDQAVRDQADIDAATAVLMGRHLLSRVEARALLQQIALEDGTTDLAAAHAVVDDPRG